MKKVFLVYGHYNDKSFNFAIKDNFIKSASLLQLFIFVSIVAQAVLTLSLYTGRSFLSLKDIPKTLVYKIAKFYNKKYPNSKIPLGIINREPSAELRPNQKDSDSLPHMKI